MSPQPSARRRSLDHRLRNTAQATRQDVQRLRRQLAFHRLLARVEGAGWVLKGGYCLEARLGGQARATKDMDFVRRTSSTEDELLDELDAMFARTTVDDGFAFETLTAKGLRSPDHPSAVWRVAVACTMDGVAFERLTLDVVSQFAEVAEAVEPLVIPCPVPAIGLAPVTVPAVDVHQHAAEKFHAMSRVYAQDRPSSRVKDLVDLALLTDAGLLADPAALHQRLVVVWRERDAGLPPGDLPTPPADWASGYARLVADLHLSLTTSALAFERVRAVYLSALSEGRAR